MAGPASATPLVSIITATYNRSNVLEYTLKSARRSTVGDWELIVVGDHCTDDTAAVVARLGDERIRFHNLPENFGEQSYPNNCGLALARGRYVAYLNHDDLWWPDHLATVLDALESSDADLAYTPILAVAPSGQARLLGVPPGDRFDPATPAPASSWLVRRDVVAALGGWRPYHRCYTYPSHDFLWRAWRAGRTIRFVPRVTVLALLSGLRERVYADRAHEENREYFERMATDPDLRERLTTRAAVAMAAEAAAPRGTPPVRWLRRGVRRALAALDVPPSGFRLWLRYGGRGGLIHDLRRRRGLGPIA